MTSRFLDKRIPTLVGILIIAIGTIFTTYLVKGDTLFEIKAGPNQEPKNIKIANISDDSFTVSYITDDNFSGTLNFGTAPDQLNILVLDDRDQLTQTINSRSSHSLTVRELEPNTSYFFSITSGDKKYFDNGSAYTVQTGSSINNNPSSQIPIAGRVIMPDGSVPNDGIVYVKISGAQDVSTVLKSDGTYTIPLNNLRNSSLNDYFPLSENTIITIEVFSANLVSKIEITPDQINPVPTISLSGNYDFSASDPEISPEDISTRSSELFPSVGIKKKIEIIEPQILTPEEDEKLDSQFLTFEGTAQPNEVVEIEIHSDENITTQVLTDDDGNWSYAPPSNLTEGEHTITIKTINSAGIIRTITKTFTIPKAQGQVIEDATPTPSPTPTPTIESTPSPTTISQSSISAIPILPPAGNSSLIIVSVIGIITVFSGTFLYLLTRKQNLL